MNAYVDEFTSPETADDFSEQAVNKVFSAIRTRIANSKPRSGHAVVENTAEGSSYESAYLYIADPDEKLGAVLSDMSAVLIEITGTDEIIHSICPYHDPELQISLQIRANCELAMEEFCNKFPSQRDKFFVAAKSELDDPSFWEKKFPIKHLLVDESKPVARIDIAKYLSDIIDVTYDNISSEGDYKARLQRAVQVADAAAFWAFSKFERIAPHNSRGEIADLCGFAYIDIRNTSDEFRQAWGCASDVDCRLREFDGAVYSQSVTAHEITYRAAAEVLRRYFPAEAENIVVASELS